MSRTTPARTQSPPLFDTGAFRPSICNSAKYASNLSYGRAPLYPNATTDLCPQCGAEIKSSHIRCPGCGVATIHSIACRWCGCGNHKTARRCGERGGQWLAEMGCGAKDWGPSWWYDKERLSITITADDSEFKRQMTAMGRAVQALQCQMGEAFLPAFERMTRAASRAVRQI